jgi:hypothetical protein
MPSTASSTAAALELPTSITVASAPADDTTVTALFTYRPPKLPGTVAPVSSPKLASAPSKSMSPYRPAPTITVSPARAFAMPREIDRHGSAAAPQVGESMPLLATYFALSGIVSANAQGATRQANESAPRICLMVLPCS